MGEGLLPERFEDAGEIYAFLDDPASNSSFKSMVQRSNLFQRAHEMLFEAGNSGVAQEARWDVLLFGLFPRRHDLYPQRYLGPMATFSDGAMAPDPRAFPPEAVEYFRRRADSVRNPVLRARYADFLWDETGEHQFARQAATAHVECVQVYLSGEQAHHGMESLRRALELSAALSDKELLGRTREYVVQTVERMVAVRGQVELAWGLEGIHALLQSRRWRDRKMLARLVEAARQGTQFCRETEGLHLERSFLEAEAALLSRLGDAEGAQHARAERAASFEREGDSQSDSGLIAAHCYQQAAQAYSDIGMAPSHLNRLKLKIDDAYGRAGAEMGTIQWEVTIDFGEFDKSLEGLKQVACPGCVMALAADESLIPDWEESKRLSKEIGQKHPLQQIIPRDTLRGRRRVARASTDDELREEAALRQYSIDLGLRQAYLSRAFTILRRDAHLSEDNITAVLSECPLVGDRLDILARGVERYFAGDWISCIHVLVPQIEQILRNLLQALGLPTTKIQGDVTREKDLDDILSTPEVREVLGERTARYFEFVLIHQRGWNLRHDVAHGLRGPDEFTQAVADVVLHLVLRLGILRTAEPER